jgi:hypothetical protein
MVLKLSGTGQGPRGLAAELVAGTVAELAGLSVPRAIPLLLPGDLPWEIGTDEFYETVQRSVGWNLGIAFVAEGTDLDAGNLSTLPPEFLSRLAAVDALLQNVDRTAANPNILRDPAGVPWAIDFGACMLIERLLRGALEPRLDLPANHILAGRTPFSISPQAIAAALDTPRLEAALADLLPDVWLAEFGLSARELSGRLRDYFRRARGT